MKCQQVPAILPTRWDWPSAIGHFLLLFGNLDFQVFVYLKDHVPAAEFEKLREMHFKDRLVKVGGLIKDDHRSDFAKMTQQIEPLRMLRNAVAHGHLVFDASIEVCEIGLYGPKDIDEYGTRTVKRVLLQEIVDSAVLLDSLIQQFNVLTGFAPVYELTKGANSDLSLTLLSQKRRSGQT